MSDTQHTKQKFRLRIFFFSPFLFYFILVFFFCFWEMRGTRIFSWLFLPKKTNRNDGRWGWKANGWSKRRIIFFFLNVYRIVLAVCPNNRTLELKLRFLLFNVEKRDSERSAFWEGDKKNSTVYIILYNYVFSKFRELDDDRRNWHEQKRVMCMIRGGKCPHPNCNVTRTPFTYT